MGRNGQCCWAGRDKLAKLVGCNPSRLSTAITDLIGWGYLEEKRHDEDGRRKGYRVVYETAEDAAGIGTKLKENRLQDGNLSDEGTLQTGNLSRANRLPESNQSSRPEARKSEINQLVSASLPKPNIFGRNQDITQKRGFGDGTKPPDRVLAAWLGSGDEGIGWRMLASLPDDELTRLRQGYADGTLDPGDLSRARQCAGKAVAYG